MAKEEVVTGLETIIWKGLLKRLNPTEILLASPASFTDQAETKQKYLVQPIGHAPEIADILQLGRVRRRY